MNELTRLRVAALLSSMGQESRLRILEHIGDGECSVGEISESLKLPQSSTSQHLAALLRTGVLKVQRKGTSRLYSVRGPRIKKVLALMEEFCEVQGLSGEPLEEAMSE